MEGLAMEGLAMEGLAMEGPAVSRPAPPAHTWRGPGHMMPNCGRENVDRHAKTEDTVGYHHVTASPQRSADAGRRMPRAPARPPRYGLPAHW